jgi:sulfatase modifying factor 1
MKKLLLVGLIGIVLASCSTRSGHLTGVLGRMVYQPEIPLGMVYIPAGSFNMGESDPDVPFLHQTRSKTVSLQAFYMDQTEITNNEYRQFVNWVRDSIAREKIYAGLEDDEESSLYINYQDEYFDEAGLEMAEFDPSERTLNRSSDPKASLFSLNWDRKFSYDDPDIIPLLVDMYYPQPERFYQRREIDTRKLNFRYFWVDLREAARRGRVEIVPNGYDKDGTKDVPDHRELNTASFYRRSARTGFGYG